MARQTGATNDHHIVDLRPLLSRWSETTARGMAIGVMTMYVILIVVAVVAVIRLFG